MFVSLRSHFVFCLSILIFGLGSLAGADSSRIESDRVVKPNYAQAQKYSSEFLKQFIYSTSVQPEWIGETDTFWYSFRTSKGNFYWKVNPKTGTKEALFDRVKLATALSESTKKPQEPNALNLSRGKMNAEGTKFSFVAEDFNYDWDLKTEKLTKGARAPRTPVLPKIEGMTEEQIQRFMELRKSENQEQQKDGQEQKQEKKGFGRFGGGKGSPLGKGGRNSQFFSPDRKVYLFERNNNLFLMDTEAKKTNPPILRVLSTHLPNVIGQGLSISIGQALNRDLNATQLTTDGAEEYSFVRMATFGSGMDDGINPPKIDWHKDSKSFYATRVDSRGVQELFVVNSLANPRPVLEKYKYPMPGESAPRRMELWVGDRVAKKMVRVKPKWKDEAYFHIHWGKTSDELRFIRRDRFQRNAEFCSINVHTGETKCLVLEGFENADIDYQMPHYLDESNEMIWWSERSGWGHFYLYDREGKLKNPITSGQYRASRIVAVDPKKRELFFTANGKEPGENIYNDHLYRVNLDGTKLTLLTPGNATHRASLSPSKQYLVDNCSRVDLAPVSYLRDATGKELMKLEETDLTRLQEIGWKMPEAFSVKAADGVTDLYGNMWKPFDFDPKKKYPIIAHVYPGPQTEGVTATFSASSGNQQLAQLGFIVIQVGHRGGTPQRSKAYGSFGYYNLRDYGLADKKSAIEQLAARCSFMDIDRVGIYGHSGGGFMSASAMLQKPFNEFFKAAVASAGNHDNNIYNNGWAERYHGMKEVPITEESKGTSTTLPRPRTRPNRPESTTEQDDTNNKKSDDESLDPTPKVDSKTGTKLEIKVPTNAELAANLKGALLLVHGEMDNNVHPANTMRLVDALIKANKRFDMLIIPGKRHGFGDAQPYFTQRMWEFFAQHLMEDRRIGADLLEKK